jgi:hypothetical protein
MRAIMEVKAPATLALKRAVDEMDSITSSVLVLSTCYPLRKYNPVNQGVEDDSQSSLDLDLEDGTKVSSQDFSGGRSP